MMVRWEQTIVWEDLSMEEVSNTFIWMMKMVKTMTMMTMMMTMMTMVIITMMIPGDGEEP